MWACPLKMPRRPSSPGKESSDTTVCSARPSGVRTFSIILSTVSASEASLAPSDVAFWATALAAACPVTGGLCLGPAKERDPGPQWLWPLRVTATSTAKSSCELLPK
eukprot:CAMPEP_0115053982 /NCGR_PEP_ID=MMETSP0227-20121206/3832_1 /TAXON_ID=89957 /ORGANISM="Polarella glacialis, Strain CCMP 1383" /LENGTH=106 /DNA_ID=CAMNT_0002438389 /DNA_START=749 /DNA_END=1069 /DNA_ORIENTATION=-